MIAVTTWTTEGMTAATSAAEVMVKIGRSHTVLGGRGPPLHCVGGLRTTPEAAGTVGGSTSEERSRTLSKATRCVRKDETRRCPGEAEEAEGSPRSLLPLPDKGGR